MGQAASSAELNYILWGKQHLQPKSIISSGASSFFSRSQLYLVGQAASSAELNYILWGKQILQPKSIISCGASSSFSRTQLYLMGQAPTLLPTDFIAHRLCCPPTLLHTC